MSTGQPRARRCVALVTSEALKDLYEDDLPLVGALATIGIDSTPVVWSDTSVDWMGFDALVMRTPWDYFVRLAEFRAWLDARIASGVRMCNSAAMLDWNFDKRYLRDLAAAGVAVVPTIVVAQGGASGNVGGSGRDIVADIVGLASARGWDEIVVKPTISGGAYLTHRFRCAHADRYAGDIARTLEDRALLVQPFLPEILRDGELSLLFFGGEFSHAVRKRAQNGDYRVQFSFGGTTEAIEARDEWIEAARACIAAACVACVAAAGSRSKQARSEQAHSEETRSEQAIARPVYARVDGVVLDGRFVLMELEVFEPLMFLAQHPEAPARFARAISDALV